MAQAESTSWWSQFKQKMPWARSKEATEAECEESLACKAYKIYGQTKELADAVAEKATNFWHATDPESLACRTKEAASTSYLLAQQVADIAKDAAIKAGEKLSETWPYTAQEAATKTADVANQALNVAKDATKKAVEMGIEAASKSADVANQAVNIAKDAAIKAGETLSETWSNTAQEAAAKSADAANQAVNIAKGATKRAVEKSREAASFTADRVAGTVTHLSANAQDAIKSISNLSSDISESFKNVALNFANCSSEKNLTCKRCQRIKVNAMGIDDEFCITLNYLPDEYALETSIDLGSTNLYHSTYSLSNPPPVCFVPVGFDHIVNVCLIFTNLSVDKTSKRLSGCLSLKTALLYDSINKSYVKELGCFSLGP